MKWLKWLLGTGGECPVKVEETTCCDTKDTKCCDPVVEANAGRGDADPVVEEKVEGFVDEETGKVYKTAGALKGAQTRRKNKAKKAKK